MFDKVRIKFLDSKEAKKLVELVKICYGSSYFYKNFYNESYVQHLINEKIIKSLVAVNKENKVIGHITLFKNDTIGSVALNGRVESSVLGEPAMLMVDPNYRNQGILTYMMKYMLENVNFFIEGLEGIFCPPVSEHVYSQLIMYKNQFKDCGCLVGYYPNADFKKISNYKNQRISLVLTYLPLDTKKHDIIIPEELTEIVKYIFSNLSIKVNYINRIFDNRKTKKSKTKISVKVNKSLQNASIKILEFGEDIIESVEKEKILLINNGIESILLYLSLNNSQTAYYYKFLRSIGFIFAGVLPSMSIGDALILQYINVHIINFDSIHLASNEANKILNFIKTDKNNLYID